MIHLGERLVDYAVGADAPGVEDHLRGCPSCRAELAALEEALAELPLALAPIAAPPELRASLLDAAKYTHVAALAGHFDVSVAAARALLDVLDDEDAWVPGPFPGVDVVHLEGGPATAGADVGLVRNVPGYPMVEHDHLGEERVLVLQGELRDSRGHVFRPGDVCVMRPGERHGHVAGATVALIFALVLWGGIEAVGG